MAITERYRNIKRMTAVFRMMNDDGYESVWVDWYNATGIDLTNPDLMTVLRWAVKESNYKLIERIFRKVARRYEIIADSVARYNAMA